MVDGSGKGYASGEPGARSGGKAILLRIAPQTKARVDAQITRSYQAQRRSWPVCGEAYPRDESRLRRRPGKRFAASRTKEIAGGVP